MTKKTTKALESLWIIMSRKLNPTRRTQLRLMSSKLVANKRNGLQRKSVRDVVSQCSLRLLVKLEMTF